MPVAWLSVARLSVARPSVARPSVSLAAPLPLASPGGVGAGAERLKYVYMGVERGNKNSKQG